MKNRLRMKDGARAAVGVGLALFALASCEGRHVSVGEVEQALNLDVCAGWETDCRVNVDVDTMFAPAAGACDGEPVGTVEVDFQVELVDALCANSSCLDTSGHELHFDPIDLAVAPDGHSWLVGTTTLESVEGDTLWVARFDPEGALLDVNDLAPGVPLQSGGRPTHRASIAVDDRGHALVAVYEVDAGPNADSDVIERNWLVELDEDGRIVGGPTLLAGIGGAIVAISDRDTVTIAANAAGNAKRGVIARLTRDGERVWSRRDVRSTGNDGTSRGVTGLAVDSSGHAMVLSERPLSGPRGKYGLTRFDAAGIPLWDRTFDIDFPNGAASGLAGDAEGNVVFAVTPEEQGRTTWLARVGTNGEVDWAYDIVGTSTPPVPVAMAVDGATYYPVETPSNGFIGGLAVIAPDGSECVRYAVPWNDFIRKQVFDGAGNLYMFGQSSLSRVHLPTE